MKTQTAEALKSLNQGIRHNKEARLKLLLKASGDREFQQVLLEKCKRDIHFWVDYFVWTHDTRRKGRLPFISYDCQRRAIDELKRCIDTGEDLGIDKSRDMGVSWVTVIVLLWYWLYEPGALFHVGSRKEEYVDRPGDMKTLFVKARYIINSLPYWMKPKGLEPRRHMTFMKLENPENGNTITGESANTEFSRGGRFKAILLDEFAFWPFSNSVWTAAADSTPCRIPVSTPNGKGNRFGKLMTSRKPGERIQNKLTLHWSEHPLKTQEWYEGEKARRSPAEIAQELDINYDQSVEGVVFKEFNNRAHVVSEAYVFKPDWKTVVSFDFGLTCSALISQIDPYETLHVFKEIIFHNTGSTEDIAEAVRQFMGKHETRGQIIYTCDPAGTTGEFKTKSKVTDVQILEAAGFKPMLFHKAKRMPNRLRDGISLMQRLLSTRYQGRERIQIYEQECETLIEAFQSEYHYKETNKGELVQVVEEKHPWEDIMDCLRYQVIECFTVSPEQSKKDAIIAPEIAFES